MTVQVKINLSIGFGRCQKYLGTIITYDTGSTFIYVYCSYVIWQLLNLPDICILRNVRVNSRCILADDQLLNVQVIYIFKKYVSAFGALR